MLRPLVLINIIQVTPYSYLDSSGNIKIIERNKNIELDFVNYYEINSSWESHTNTASIKFPKNIQLQDGNFLFKESGSYNVIMGGTSNENITTPPLFLKGDIVTIQDGYFFKNEFGKDITVGKTVFSGYISNVKSDIPIEIECEDNFYLLKRVPFDSTVFPIKGGKIGGKTDLYSLMQHIVDLVNEQFSKYVRNGLKLYPTLTFNEIPNAITSQFSLGYLDIGDLTCAQLLDKLKNQFHFESTFVGNSLIFGAIIYNDSELNEGSPLLGTNLNPNSENFFYFSDFYNNGILDASANIFGKDLEYSNKGDVILSTIVQCKIIVPVKGRQTKDGFQVTKKQKLKVLVYWDIPTETYKFVDLSITGTVVPRNVDGGERHTCFYPVSPSEKTPTIQNLVDLGISQLKKYYYTGFKGSFDTFGFPFIDWNYNINIIDPIISDRNGQYKVKKVTRRGGINGISQNITLDYKQQVDIPKNTKNIFMI